MPIKQPPYLRVALGRLRQGENQQFVEMATEALRPYFSEFHSDLLQGGKTELEKLAVDYLVKNFRYEEFGDNDVAQDSQRIHAALEKAESWLRAESKLPKATNMIRSRLGAYHCPDAVMRSCDHAVLTMNMFIGLPVEIHLHWQDERWHVGGAGIDDEAVFNLRSAFDQSIKNASA